MPKQSALRSLAMLWQFVSPYRAHWLGAIAALLFTAAMTLMLGQGVRQVIDGGLATGNAAQLRLALGAFMVLALLFCAGTFARFYLMSWLGERVGASLRLQVFNHLLALHPGFFESERSGDLVARLTADTTLLQSVVGSLFSMALRSAITGSGALVMLFVTDARLALIVLSGVPLVLLPMLAFGRRMRQLSRQSQDRVADLGARAGEVIQQIKTVQSYHSEGRERSLFAAEVDAAFAVARRRISRRALLIALVFLLMFGSIAAMLWYGGAAVLGGRMSAGDLGAFAFYALLMASGAATIAEAWGEMQRAVGASERLLELLAARPAIAAPPHPAASAAALQPRLDFDNLQFHYPSRPNAPALHDFDLHIKPGEVVALVGPSGAGKSTVFELLQRFYDPQSGALRFGGADIRHLDPADLRAQMATIAQEPTLFARSAADNIRYGDWQASDAQVQQAARTAQAHDFIRALPQGYNSNLGEAGVRLSGGQRQRIAIARALLKNPRVLLLDEATSALDSESERAVQQGLERLMQGRTVLIIAHRLSTVINASRIVVMNNGRIEAQGDHPSLMAHCPLYAHLAQLQFGNPQSPPNT